MKTVALALITCLFSAALLRADNGPAYKPESRMVTETFSTKVLKVLSFVDQDSEYVAYVVDWKGHEVVVTPRPWRKDDRRFSVGETVQCQMSSSAMNLPEGAKARLSFSFAADATRRLEEITAEVKRRRAQREAAGNSTTAQAQLVVEIDSMNTISIGGAPVPPEKLEAVLKKKADGVKDVSIMVAASEKSSLTTVTLVMDTCRKLGLNKLVLQSGN